MTDERDDNEDLQRSDLYFAELYRIEEVTRSITSLSEEKFTAKRKRRRYMSSAR